MGRWGVLDKKGVAYVLSIGLSSLEDNIKDKTIDNKESAWREYNDLYKLLYEEGKDLLSTTNKIKFERKLNKIQKMIEKF